jgi:hypothetical protein
LNAVSLPYWKILKENTEVKNVEVSKEDLEFDVEKIQHFSLSKNEEQEMMTSKTFLEKIVPKTKILLKIVEKYIHGK